MPRKTHKPQPGVHEHRETITTSTEIPEGQEIGKLVIISPDRQQRLPWTRLEAIFQAAGLPKSALPKHRAASDAFRLAVGGMNNKFLETGQHGVAKILVRNWEGGHSPAKDLTLESQNYLKDHFEYTSPAARIYFDPQTQEMFWDNRLSPNTEAEARQLLETMLDGIKEEFIQRRDLTDGDAVYYSINKIMDSITPLTIGKMSWLVYKEYDGLVQSLKSMISALNEEGGANSINIFTVINTEEDRLTLSQALDKEVQREVELALDRMARIMKEPEAAMRCQGQLELENFERISAMVDEYFKRIRRDRATIDAKLNVLWQETAALMTTVVKNPDKRTKGYKQAQAAAAQTGVK